jgi:hypothetical protein
MRFDELVRRAERLVANNGPLILTAIGVTGTITTALFTGRASFKAAKIIAAEEAEARLTTGFDGYECNTRRKFDLTWQLYIPAVGTGVLTVVCIVAANRIGSRRAAAMAAAYSLTEKAFVEYKNKVIENIGARKEQNLRDDIAQERVDANPVTHREVILTGNGDVLCYDSITGRYFESNVETLRKAQNEINYQILHEMSASLSDLYRLIGLPTTQYSNEVGWNADTLLEMKFSTVMSTDDRPCISLEYTVYPIRDYCRIQ